jgi:RNA polymerase sigma-70 factor (ECF subfamily)
MNTARNHVSMQQAALHENDRCLARDCIEGIPRALEVFEQLLAGLDPAVLAAGVSTHDLADIKQRLRHRLVVDEPGRPAKLRSYRGQGSLGGWLRVCAVREALQLLRARKATRIEDDGALQRLVAEESDPETHLMDAQLRSLFREAFTAALGELDPTERNVLRYQVLDGLSSEDIARVYGVHRVTVTRWAAKARTRLLRATRRKMGLELRISHAEFQNVVGMLTSRLDVSFGRVLRPEDCAA